MRFYYIAFFFDKGEAPMCEIKTYEGPTVHVSIIPHDGETRPAITLFLKDEQDLIDFKNNVIWAFDTYMRRKYNNGNRNCIEACD